MDSSQDLESVIEKIRNNDRDGLERLFAEHRDYLKQVVRLRMDSQTRKRVDVSDVVQEAHLEALRRVKEFVRNPVMPVRLWLRQIACDRLVMAQRRHIGAARRSVNREYDLPDNLSVSIARKLTTGVSGPESAAARRETARLVQDTVAALPDHDREIILLQAFEGLNSTESAHVLGIEPAAARKRFGRALLRLRATLVKNGLKGPLT